VKDYPRHAFNALRCQLQVLSNPLEELELAQRLSSGALMNGASSGDGGDSRMNRDTREPDPS
jgi:hypothetical protein